MAEEYVRNKTEYSFIRKAEHFYARLFISICFKRRQVYKKYEGGELRSTKTPHQASLMGCLVCRLLAVFVQRGRNLGLVVGIDTCGIQCHYTDDHSECGQTSPQLIRELL